MTTTPSRSRESRLVWRSFRDHSRTFSLAARLLPRRVQLPVASLYGFCRSVDTLADERVREVGADAALDELAAMRRALDDTLDGRPPDRLVWRRLADVHRRFTLDRYPLYQLLDGARWDLEGRPVTDRDDLIAYSDLVGGSVGAMMLPFLLDGDRRPDLDGAARALGIGMQIANIVRDVGEDVRDLDRVYLPTRWMERHGLARADLLAERPPQAYAALLEETMRTAEHFFDRGAAGIDALPLRVRPAIRAAARMYREIMNEVRARRYDNLRHRVYVSLPRKLGLIVHDGYAARRDRLCPRHATPAPRLYPSAVQP